MMRKQYEQPGVEMISFTSEENLMLEPIGLTPSSVEGGFGERNQ